MIKTNSYATIKVQVVLNHLLLHFACSQFHRVLSELEMGGLVNAMEFQLLYRKFDVRVGGRNDVNYIAFCQMIDGYAQTRWSDPSLK